MLQRLLRHHSPHFLRRSTFLTVAQYHNPEGNTDAQTRPEESPVGWRQGGSDSLKPEAGATCPKLQEARILP